MDKPNKTPKLRFLEFHGGWEQRKFNDIAEKLSETMVSDNKYPSIEYEDVISEEGSLNKDLHSKSTYKKGIKFSSKDVLYGKLRPYLHNWFNPDFDGVAVGDWWVLRAKNTDKDFLYRLLQTPLFDNAANQSTGTKMPRADWKLISNLMIFSPSDISEQKKIGSFFRAIDNLITLHQRKYETLQNIKKSLLQKMFPKDGESFPEVRFPGFSDAWEQRKLEDYLDVSKVKNTQDRFNKEDVLSVSGDYGIVNQIKFQGRSFAGASVSNYGVVETGDIVYTKSPLKANPYGIIKTNKGAPGIVSTLYAVYKPKNNVCSEFVQIYFELDSRMNNYIHPLVNKGAKNDMKVSSENALKGKIIFPSKTEQEKISSFFLKLDNLITLHQRKNETLTTIKKSLLQQMFV